MDKKQIYMIIAVAILIVGMTAVIAGYFIIRSDEPVKQTEEMKNMDHSLVPMGVNMESTLYKKYAALKGEDYDKAFTASMIVHHENAVSMAKFAATNASRQEIKDLAATIVTSQGKELADMTNWRTQWGYTAVSDHNLKDVEHDGSKTEEKLTTETKLKKLTGNDFDKAFLELMIMHHEDAVNMAAPAQANASHPEVKKLAQDIVITQTKEMTQMRTWQTQWGLNGV